MKNFGSSQFLFISLLVVSGAALSISWFARGCLIFDCPPKRDFSVFDMNIPQGYLPDRRSIELKPDKGIINATEQSHGGAVWDSGEAVYIVIRFGTEKQASAWFDVQVKQDMFYPDSSTLESHQDILIHSMPSANDYKIRCGYILKDFRCILDARYQEFYVFFSSSMATSQMTNGNYIALMNYLDARMGKLLETNK